VVGGWWVVDGVAYHQCFRISGVGGVAMDNDLRGYFEGQLRERLGVPVWVLDRGVF